MTLAPITRRLPVLFLVHVEAALRAPHAYLVASWWRLLGKRRRARSQFAPLLAAAPHAYRLWRMRHDIDPDADQRDDVPIRIVALVTQPTHPGYGDTLRSLAAEGIAVIAVGTPDVPGPRAAADHIDQTQPTWLMPLAGGDVLTPGAARIYRRAAAATTGRIIYADDDLRDANGKRTRPHLKPDWNAELFRHFDYIAGACMVRADAATLRMLPDKDWPRRLVEVATYHGTPTHLPFVLHQRRSRPDPHIPARPAVSEEPGLPRMTVIVPTRNRRNLLQPCLEGLAKTRYPALEIIVVDNDSDDPSTLEYLATLDPARHRVLHHPGSFNFSTINNRAARQARGQLLCLLNNDIAVLDPDWLALLARQAMRAEIGAVGARLLYPDGRIQHAGVALGIGGAATHVHRLLEPEAEGYFHRHAVPHFVSAVTAACLVVQTERFFAVGGLDERDFSIAFNDVDFCMRLNRRGWQTLYEPRATLIHHESVSRGFDRDPAGAERLAREVAALRTRWATDRIVDPFHHPALSRESERFALDLSGSGVRRVHAGRPSNLSQTR